MKRMEWREGTVNVCMTESGPLDVPRRFEGTPLVPVKASIDGEWYIDAWEAPFCTLYAKWCGDMTRKYWERWEAGEGGPPEDTP